MFTILVLIVIAAVAYYYRDAIKKFWKDNVSNG